MIRIGAVNCGDNHHLCRSKGINSYPSLFIYRAEQVCILMFFSPKRNVTQVFYNIFKSDGSDG